MRWMHCRLQGPKFARVHIATASSARDPGLAGLGQSVDISLLGLLGGSNSRSEHSHASDAVPRARTQSRSCSCELNSVSGAGVLLRVCSAGRRVAGTPRRVHGVQRGPEGGHGARGRRARGRAGLHGRAAAAAWVA